MNTCGGYRDRDAGLCGAGSWTQLRVQGLGFRILDVRGLVFRIMEVYGLGVQRFGVVLSGPISSVCGL